MSIRRGELGIGLGDRVAFAVAWVMFAFWGSDQAHAFGKQRPADKGLVWVAQGDGSLQCEPDSGVSLAQGASELEGLGVQVFEKKKTTDGKMRMQLCGAPTGQLNAYLVSAVDFEKVQKQTRFVILLTGHRE